MQATHCTCTDCCTCCRTNKHTSTVATWQTISALLLSILLPLVKGPAGTPWPHKHVQACPLTGQLGQPPVTQSSSCFHSTRTGTHKMTPCYCVSYRVFRNPKQLYCPLKWNFVFLMSVLMFLCLDLQWYFNCKKMTKNHCDPLDVCNCIQLASSFYPIFGEKWGTVTTGSFMSSQKYVSLFRQHTVILWIKSLPPNPMFVAIHILYFLLLLSRGNSCFPSLLVGCQSPSSYTTV